jgi:molybdopterin-guanine dinucleotide biosynthesis protein
MDTIKREIEPVLRKMAGQFKAVAITGPRQSGKTTLAKTVFPDKPYVSLETPDERDRAMRVSFFSGFLTDAYWMKSNAHPIYFPTCRKSSIQIRKRGGLF